jgi:hypothetical protein
MTVADLIEILDQFAGNLEVRIEEGHSVDSEYSHDFIPMFPRHVENCNGVVYIGSAS